MLKYVFGCLFLVLIVLLEASVFPLSFLLVILLALQFLEFSKEAHYTAFFGGVLLDLLVGTPFGLSSLTLLLLSGAVGMVRRFAEGQLLILLLTTFVASIIFRTTQIFPTFKPVVLCKGGVLDVCVIMLVYPILRYVLKSWFGRREIQVGV